MKKMFALTIVALLFTAAAPAATPDTIAGEWTADLQMHEMTFPLALKLAVHDAQITGTSEGGHGSGTVDGDVAGDKITLRVKTGEMTLVLTGTIKDGTMTGTFEMGTTAGHGGTWTATRKVN